MTGIYGISLSGSKGPNFKGYILAYKNNELVGRFQGGVDAGKKTGKDRNTLNNQKYNLRTCTSSQNQGNKKKQSSGKTSKFKGVGIHESGYYRARISVNGKLINKYFPPTPEGEIQAALHYNKLARKHFGEFANLNTINSV